MEIEKICFGDCVLVLLGEFIFVDGRVVSGKSVVEEVMFIGEFLFVFKLKGDSVFVGIINWEGLIKV